MRFTVAIPVRNGSRFLAEAIRSALNQTRAADEILIIDDNSQDDSAVIAKSSEWQGRVKYFWHQTPTGFVDAWNRLAQKATGDYIAILHQDDLLDANYLAAMENALKRFPRVRHLYTSCRYIDGTGNVLRSSQEAHSAEPVLYSGREYARHYLRGAWRKKHIHRCPGVMTERKLLLTECSYRKDAGHIADDDFFYRVGTFTDVIGVQKPLASYREHDLSTTAMVNQIDLVLARDYIYQIRHQIDRAQLLSPDDEILFHKLAVRSLNEGLYHLLLKKYSQWDVAFEIMRELNEVAPGAWNKYLPIWGKFMWIAARKNNIRMTNISVLAVRIYRGGTRRLGFKTL